MSIADGLPTRAQDFVQRNAWVVTVGGSKTIADGPNGLRAPFSVGLRDFGGFTVCRFCVSTLTDPHERMNILCGIEPRGVDRIACALRDRSEQAANIF